MLILLQLKVMMYLYLSFLTNKTIYSIIYIYNYNNINHRILYSIYYLCDANQLTTVVLLNVKLLEKSILVLLLFYAVFMLCPRKAMLLPFKIPVYYLKRIMLSILPCYKHIDNLL